MNVDDQANRKNHREKCSCHKLRCQRWCSFRSLSCCSPSASSFLPAVGKYSVWFAVRACHSYPALRGWGNCAFHAIPNQNPSKISSFICNDVGSDDIVNDDVHVVSQASHLGSCRYFVTSPSPRGAPRNQGCHRQHETTCGAHGRNYDGNPRSFVVSAAALASFVYPRLSRRSTERRRVRRHMRKRRGAGC